VRKVGRRKENGRRTQKQGLRANNKKKETRNSKEKEQHCGKRYKWDIVRGCNSISTPLLNSHFIFCCLFVVIIY